MDLNKPLRLQLRNQPIFCIAIHLNWDKSDEILDAIPTNTHANRVRPPEPLLLQLIIVISRLTPHTSEKRTMTSL